MSRGGVTSNDTANLHHNSDGNSESHKENSEFQAPRRLSKIELSSKSSRDLWHQEKSAEESSESTFRLFTT